MPLSGLAVPPVRKALIAFALIVAVVLGFRSLGNVGRPMTTAKAGLEAAELEQHAAAARAEAVTARAAEARRK